MSEFEIQAEAPVYHQEDKKQEAVDTSPLPSPEMLEKQLESAAAKTGEAPYEKELKMSARRFDTEKGHVKEVKVPAGMEKYHEKVMGYCDRAEERIKTLKAVTPEERKMLADLYMAHADNIYRLSLPLWKEKETADLLRDHYDDFLTSPLLIEAGEKGQAGQFTLEDELLRAKTVEAVLSERGIDKDQQPAKDRPAVLRTITVMYLVDQKEAGLKKKGVGYDPLDLPAFLESAGGESETIDFAIRRYKDARYGFHFLRAGKTTFDEWEAKYREAEKKKDELLQKRDSLYKKYLEQDEDSVPEEELIDIGMVDEAGDEYDKANEEFVLQQRIREYYTDAQREWVQQGDVLGSVLSRSLTRAFSKAQEVYAAKQGAEKEGYRENCFRDLAVLSEKMGNIGLMYSHIVYDERLDKENEAKFHALFEQAMAQFNESATAVWRNAGESYEELKETAEEMIAAAGQTLQLLSREKRKLRPDYAEKDPAKEVEDLATERSADQKKYLAMETAAEKIVQQRALERREAEEKQALEDRKAKIEADQAAAEQAKQRLIDEAERATHVLRLSLTNTYASDQEVLKPKEVLGKISAYTASDGSHVKSVSKTRILWERMTGGIGASKLGRRIEKHVDRFLSGNGEITDGDLAEVSSRIARASGLYSYAEGSPDEKRLALFQELSEADTPDEIKRIADQIKNEDFQSPLPDDELDLDDPFYIQFPDARKTVLLYRLSHDLADDPNLQTQGDLHTRLLAVSKNLAKLKKQVVDSDAYTSYRAKAAWRTVNGQLAGYRSDLNQVEQRLANPRSTLDTLPELDEYRERLRERNEAFEKRVEAARKAVPEKTNEQAYYEMLANPLMAQINQFREQTVTESIRLLRLSRQSDQEDRKAFMDSLRSRPKAAEKLTLESFRKLMDQEIFLHEAFKKNTGLFAEFLGAGDPPAAELLDANKQLIRKLVLERIHKDKPGGIKSQTELLSLPREEFREYAARLRGRLINLKAVYTKDRADWFSDPKFTEELITKLLNGEGNDIGELITYATELHLNLRERKQVLDDRELILLRGRAWDNMHAFVEMRQKQKSFGRDAIRSDSRLIRLMEADQKVEDICRSLGVEKPLSYYEVLARDPKAESKELSEKQEYYEAYLKQWCREAEERMKRPEAPDTTAAQAKAAELKERIATADDAIAGLKEAIEKAKEEIRKKEKEQEARQDEAITQIARVKEAAASYETLKLRLERAGEDVERLKKASESEAEQEKARREVKLSKAEKRLKLLQEQMEALQKDREAFEQGSRYADQFLEEGGQELEQARSKLERYEKQIGDRRAEREKALLDLEKASEEILIAQLSAEQGKKKKAPSPKDVVDFLTARVSQRLLATEKSNMLEYGVHDVASFLLKGGMQQYIDGLKRTEYNEELERSALHFFRCRRLTEQALREHPDKEALLPNFERMYMQYATVSAYETAMKGLLSKLGEGGPKLKLLSERKDRRLEVFRSTKYMAYLPLVPLLLEDDKCLEHILCDSDKDYQKFLTAVIKRTEPYMQLLGLGGVYNGMIDQYLHDYKEEILAVIHEKKPIPDPVQLNQRFIETYEELANLQITKTTISDIMEEAIGKARKEMENSEEKEEPGIPKMDPMTICTVVLLTGGTTGLRDEKRMNEYRKRAEKNRETLRTVLPEFVQYYVPEEERDSFLTGVSLMEKTMILQDPKTYAAALHERLRRYQSYQTVDFKASASLTEKQQEINTCMQTVRKEKEHGREVLKNLQRGNMAARMALMEPEKLRQPLSEKMAAYVKKLKGPVSPEAREKVMEFTKLSELLPAHGGLTSFYQGLLARVVGLSVEEDPYKAEESIEALSLTMLNMLIYDNCITTLVKEFRQNGILTGKKAEEMFRAGCYETYADFATSSKLILYEATVMRKLRRHFAKENGGEERIRVMISDTGYYGFGNKRSASEEAGFLGQASRETFEKEVRKRKCYTGKLYDEKMGDEERTLVAQIIAHYNVPVRTERTPAQKLYVDALKASGMKTEDEIAVSSPLVGIVETYLVGKKSVVPPDYREVMSILQSTMELRMDIFDEAVRHVERFMVAKEGKVPLSARDIATMLNA